MRWCGLVFVLVACKAETTNPLISEADAKAALAQWQGTWVLPYFHQGKPNLVLDVHGSDVVVWEGKDEPAQQLAIRAPCLAEISRGKRRTYYEFVFEADGALRTTGPIGVKRGDTWYICDDKQVVVYGPKTCVVYGANVRRPERDEPAPATCRTADKRVTVEVDKRSTELEIDGDRLWATGRNIHEPATRVPSLDEAKRRAQQP